MLDLSSESFPTLAQDCFELNDNVNMLTVKHATFQYRQSTIAMFVT